VPYPDIFSDLKSYEVVFAFIHLRKSGGTAVRAALDEDFVKSGLMGQTAIFITPCRFSVPCATYNISKQVKQDIVLSPRLPIRISGHFTFPDVERILEVRPEQNQKLSCLTQLRPPEERFISCFYYRTREMGRPKYLHFFKPEALKSFSHSFRDTWGYGCNNEILRMFTGLEDEDYLNNPDPDSEFTQELIKIAKQNMEKCIILIAGQDEKNNAIAERWLPNMPALQDLSKKKANVGRKWLYSVPQVYFEVVRELNKVDQILYDYGAQLHERLYRYATLF